MNEPTTTTAARGRSGRRTLIAIAALFIGPLLLSSGLYFFGDGWRPDGSVAHGRLVQPPLLLDDAVLANRADDAAFELRGRWHLVQFVPRACDAACDERIIRTRQVRLALGKESDRIGRLLVLPSDAEVTRWRAAHPDAALVLDNDPAWAPLVGAFDEVDAQRTGIFLVDPIGNLMMVFASDEGPKTIHKDLQRLLKLSNIG